MKYLKKNSKKSHIMLTTGMVIKWIPVKLVYISQLTILVIVLCQTEGGRQTSGTNLENMAHSIEYAK